VHPTSFKTARENGLALPKADYVVRGASFSEGWKMQRWIVETCEVVDARIAIQLTEAKAVDAKPRTAPPQAHGGIQRA
jgi:hypothetical protein